MGPVSRNRRLPLVRAICGAVLLLAGAFILCAGIGTASDSGLRQPTTNPVLPAIVCTQVPASVWPRDGRLPATVPTGEDRPLAARIVRVDSLDGKPRIANLTPGFAAACEPDVSFDGQRIIFAAKKDASDPWNIWEMSADGTGQRQITSGPGDRTSPRYLSPQYTLAPVGTDMRLLVAFAGGPPAAAIYTCNLDGSAPRRITYHLGKESDPFVLDDGRLVYAARQGGDRSAFLAINNDGTDGELLVQAEVGLRFKHTPCETAGGLVVFVEADEQRADGGGRLAAVSMRRNLYSYRVLADDPGGLYRAPSRLPDGRILVAYRPRDAAASYGIYTLDPATGARSAAVFDQAEWHEVVAVAILPRPRPDGRSSVVKDGTPTGRFYCLNAYLSRPAEGRPARDRTIRQVRFVATTPAGSRVLGAAPVEADGSFYVEVPASTPLRIQLLDATGELVREQQSWIWAMPGESRGCIGCHEDPELVPENVLPKAMVRGPTRLAPVPNTQGADAEPEHLEEPP
jgi:hypothetical protein